MKSRECALQLNRLEFLGEPLPPTPVFELALHYKKPEGDNQSSHELSDVAGYERLSVQRDAEHWLVEGKKVCNAKTLIFKPMKPQKRTIFAYITIGIGGIIWHVIPMKRPAEVYGFGQVGFFPDAIRLEDGALELLDQPGSRATATVVFSASAKTISSEQSRAKGRIVEVQA